MAKKKYKVQPGESFATFQNPQQVMSLNPGVASLSPGQTIWTPTPTPQNPNILQGLLPLNPGSPPGSFRPGGQPPAQTPASFGGSFYSGSQVNTGAFNVGPPQINPVFANQPEFMSPGGSNAPRPVATLTSGANSFYSGNQVNTQGQAVPQSVINNGVQPSTPITTLPPNYVYTGGNDSQSVEQRRLWNIAAGGTGDERVFLMSREQKKSIGDAKRRKRGQTERQSQAAVLPTAEEIAAPQGNAVNSGLSWRVG